MVTPPEVGQVLGERYVLAGLLGEAPGYVEYRALDKELDVEVALWWLRPELFPDPARRDAVIGAGVELRHVNDLELRQCFGVGAGRGGLWAIWRLATAPGPRPGRDPVSTTELRRWIEAAGRGLAALHRHGLVHGRLTADDVVFVGDTLKLGGGGLWRDADPAAAARLWADTTIAPEVRAGRSPTEAADVWSLAAIALQMVATGNHPQLAAVLTGAMHQDPGRRPDLASLVEAARHAAEYPYGGFALRAVSMKTPKAAVPDAPTGETPVLPKAKIRPYAEALPAARTFSVAPGQLGYLAPPRAKSEPKPARPLWLLLVLIAVLAAGGGVALALLL